MRDSFAMASPRVDDESHGRFFDNLSIGLQQHLDERLDSRARAAGQMFLDVEPSQRVAEHGIHERDGDFPARSRRRLSRQIATEEVEARVNEGRAQIRCHRGDVARGEPAFPVIEGKCLDEGGEANKERRLEQCDRVRPCQCLEAEPRHSNRTQASLMKARAGSFLEALAPPRGSRRWAADTAPTPSPTRARRPPVGPRSAARRAPGFSSDRRRTSRAGRASDASSPR